MVREFPDFFFELEIYPSEIETNESILFVKYANISTKYTCIFVYIYILENKNKIALLSLKMISIVAENFFNASGFYSRTVKSLHSLICT